VKIKRVLDSINLRSLRRLLRALYHRKGPGRKPYNPLSMLKAQLLKYLLRIPSDRRLALRLRHDWQAARACRFRKRTPSHGLFTQFRHRLGEETYQEIFNDLLRRLFESGAIIGRVIAVDSTHIKACSQRSRDNKTGRSDSEARVGRGSRRCLSPSRLPHAMRTIRSTSSLS
jgi:transposase